MLFQIFLAKGSRCDYLSTTYFQRLSGKDSDILTILRIILFKYVLG